MPVPTHPVRLPVVVVGASLGGVAALQKLAASLPADLPAAVLVVQHTAPDGPGLLGELLDAAGPLPAALATDGEPLQPGTIRVAPPDHHLLVRRDRLLLARGPRENRSRPAIDALFRSAAVAHGSAVVGVVLTGLLNDGAAGLLAVETCGGQTVVQSPADAAHADMPLNALARVWPDHTLPLAEIGGLLSRITAMPVPPSPPPPDDLVREDLIAGGEPGTIADVEAWGERAPVTCPECGGALWSHADGPILRYRCHTGHGYTAQGLIAEQSEAVEHALWAAIRVLEERAATLRALAATDGAQGHIALGRLYGTRADEAHAHAQRLRDIFRTVPDLPVA